MGSRTGQRNGDSLYFPPLEQKPWRGTPDIVFRCGRLGHVEIFDGPVRHRTGELAAARLWGCVCAFSNHISSTASTRCTCTVDCEIMAYPPVSPSGSRRLTSVYTGCAVSGQRRTADAPRTQGASAPWGWGTQLPETRQDNATAAFPQGKAAAFLSVFFDKCGNSMPELVQGNMANQLSALGPVEGRKGRHS